MANYPRLLNYRGQFFKWRRLLKISVTVLKYIIEDNTRSWNFQKMLTRLRQKLGMPEGVVFHTLRNTFATHMENLGIPRNHTSQIMGHKDSNMALDIYSAGLAIEPLVKSMKKLTYGKEIDSFIKNSLEERSSFL